MAYCIEYGKPARGERPHLGRMVCIALAVFILLIHFFWPAGREALGEILFPGDRDASGRAFSAMVSDLREGTPVGQAVAVFCREILSIDEN